MERRYDHPLRHRQEGRGRRSAPRAAGRALLAVTLLVAGSALLAPGAARAADTQYKIRPIVKLGDKMGDIALKDGINELTIGGLNDNGQIVFSTQLAEAPNGAALIQYSSSDGTFTPIAVAGRAGPAGTWRKDLLFYDPASMNQRGNVVFSALHLVGGEPVSEGTFLWDAQARKVSPVALEGMPATDNLTFEDGGDWSPVINNRDEIAFPADVRNASGNSLGFGIFLREPDGKLQSVVLPGQALPGNQTNRFTFRPSLNDAGAVAFPASWEGFSGEGAYLWEKDTITSLAVSGQKVPGGKIAFFRFAWVNDANRSVLIVARLNDDAKGPFALYQFADGALTPIAVPGQEMFGGGKLKDIPLSKVGVSPANDRGQHVFIATLEDGATAAYLMDADGKLSLIIKSGTATDLGQVTQVGGTLAADESHSQLYPVAGGLLRGGFGVSLNHQGQVALPLSIDGGPAMIALMTPVVP
jgi:hypothetical protein